MLKCVMFFVNHHLTDNIEKKNSLVASGRQRPDHLGKINNVQIPVRDEGHFVRPRLCSAALVCRLAVFNATCDPVR